MMRTDKSARGAKTLLPGNIDVKVIVMIKTMRGAG